jgi:hypothetical protein
MASSCACCSREAAMTTLAVLAYRTTMAMVSSENLAGVFSPRCYNRIFLLLLLVYVFASLQQVFLLQSLCGFAPSQSPEDFVGFFFFAPMLH